MKKRHGILSFQTVALTAALLVSAWVSVSTAQPKPNRNLEAFNTIRMARAPAPSVWLARGMRLGDEVDRIFARYRDGRYNYVLIEVSLIDTTSYSDTVAPNPNDSSLVAHLRLVIRKAAEYGLRVIPQVGLGAPHSLAWERMSDKIQMTRLKTCETPRHRCVQGTPSYAADPLGIDTSLARMFIAIRKAFSDSTVRYPLEYVHLGYDEFANNYADGNSRGIILPGHAVIWKDSRNPRMGLPFSYVGGAYPPRTLSRAKVDSAFIANSGAPTKSQAVQRLLVNSLHRRLLQARHHLDPGIKVMVYADDFDAEFLGRITYYTDDLDTVRFSGTMTTLPGLSAPQAAFLRANLILMPWNYFDTVPMTGRFYDPGKTFAQFTNSGYKTVYAVGIHNGDYKDTVYDWVGLGREAMRRYVDSSRSFKGAVLGYSAMWWRSVAGDTGQGDISRATYDTIRKYDVFPRASIRYDQTVPVTRLLFR